MHDVRHPVVGIERRRLLAGLAATGLVACCPPLAAAAEARILLRDGWLMADSDLPHEAPPDA
jgi:hypothetical protein